MKTKPSHADFAGARYLALQRLARSQGRPTDELLQLYMLECFLRRLSRSPYRDRLVLKGGLLLAAFDLRRATRDVDLLALRVDNDPAAAERVIVEVATTEAEDGVEFVLDALHTDAIRDDDAYPGVRVTLDARLASARIRFSVDLNVGDPVVPAPVSTTFPALLADDPIPLLAYPIAMVVAEKLVTALQRGAANTRWRDFADLFLLVDKVGHVEVVEALRAVAEYRGVALRAIGEALEEMPRVAQARWTVWLKRQGSKLAVPDDFEVVLGTLDRKSRAWISEATG
jgi:predicted nucleotidyltransferase component of viral defense system